MREIHFIPRSLKNQTRKEKKKIWRIISQIRSMISRRSPSIFFFKFSFFGVFKKILLLSPPQKNPPIIRSWNCLMSRYKVYSAIPDWWPKKQVLMGACMWRSYTWNIWMIIVAAVCVCVYEVISESAHNWRFSPDHSILKTDRSN